MRFDGPQVSDAFGSLLTKGVTIEFLWNLVKCCKHARLRCRSNVALNAWLRRCFPNFKFEQVEKQGRDGKPYFGLKIVGTEGSIMDEDNEE